MKKLSFKHYLVFQFSWLNLAFLNELVLLQHLFLARKRETRETKILLNWKPPNHTHQWWKLFSKRPEILFMAIQDQTYCLGNTAWKICITGISLINYYKYSRKIIFQTSNTTNLKISPSNYYSVNSIILFYSWFAHYISVMSNHVSGSSFLF